MELGLRLGDTLHDEKPLNDLIDISNEKYHDDALGFCMRLTRPSSSNFLTTDEEMNTKTDHPSAVQLHLLPFSPLPNPFPCLLLQPQNQNLLNLKHSVDAGTGSSSSSPNSSMMSSFRKEFAVYKRDQHHHHNHAVEADHRSEYINNSRKRGSDDEDEKNGVLLSRKKLRLTKDQSAFLEHSFKLHHTLNPKQKLGLAKQLKLRPRQVEVWFQNRRARTKLKQTEVDCEYLKRCCETLREENKRLQKEVQELRALKSCKPNYMQLLPPTTLTMCPSCERLTPPTTITVAAAAAAPPPPSPDTKPKPPRLHTFLQEYQSHALQAS